MKYVLEPMLFAFNEDLLQEELIDYLEELLSLDGWWDQHREDMYVLDAEGTALWNNNYYPIASTLKPLMEKYCIQFIQFNDINKSINKMLSKSREIETLYDEGLCEMKQQKLQQLITANPEVKRHKELHDEFMKLLWHIFMAHEVGGYEENAFVVFTKGISGNISVDYEYYLIDKNLEFKEKTGNSEVNCKSSLSDFLYDEKTPFLLWKTAKRKEDLDLGVRIDLLQLKNESDLTRIYEDYNFVIQDSFYDDYCTGHYKNKDQDIRSTIHAVRDAVTELNLTKMHAIRTGKSGNAPQLIISGYAAERRNITTSIKLSYWKKGCEYRIANMREHDFIEPSWER